MSLALVLAVVALATLAFVTFLAARKISSKEELEADAGGNHHELEDRSNRLRAGLRRRRGGQRRRGQPDADGEEEEEEIEEQKAVSRKDAYEARRAARDAEREAIELAQEQEILRAAEEREAKEQEEAEKWMHMFTVDDAGEEAQNKEQGEQLLCKMVEYITKRKMVPLEDIAAEFGIRTSEVIEKVKELESTKRITGIMDDRGKYIYISDEEMRNVADFIRKRGRIGISDLARETATLINFDGVDEDVKDIELDDMIAVSS